MAAPQISSHPSEDALGQEEDTPLLAGGQPSPRPAYEFSTLLSARRQNTRVSGMFWVAEISILLWLVTLFIVVLNHHLELFTFHPIFQSLAVLLFYQGILILQPTQTPSEKRTGLLVHEFFQVLGTISLAVGSSVILAVKISHHAPHFTSWHGKFGLISASLIVVQALFGALIGFEFTRDHLIGDARARALWKFHRASGYLIVVLLTVTVVTATRSDWLLSFVDSASLWILTIAPIVSVLGLLSLLNLNKIFRR